MNKRSRRKMLVAMVVFGVAVATVLALTTFEENLLYFYSPTQIHAGEAPENRSFRVGGLVVDGSVRREQNSLAVQFDLTDNAEVIGVSVDSHFTHLAWKNTPRDQGGIGGIRYPLVADLDKHITRDYGILSDDSVALRGLFLIDKDGVVRHELVNDLGLGRSVDEAIRMLDALQLTEEKGEVCPANWQKGDEAMKPTADGVADYLAKHAS